MRSYKEVTPQARGATSFSWGSRTKPDNRRKIMKMKLFTGQGDAAVLEGEMNEWLEKNPFITVKNVEQSYVSRGEQLHALISVWYDA